MIVVADTSILLNFAFLGKADVLSTLFGEVLIPEAVAREFARMSASSGRFGSLSLPACCRMLRLVGLPPALASDARLDPGEAEAIGLAIETGASAVLVDEISGRQVAISHGLVVIGTLGLLIAAKERGLVAEIAPLLRRLIVDGSFRVGADLLRETLRRTGELSGY